METEMKNEILAAIESVNKKVEEIQKQVAKIPEIEKQVAKIPEIEKQVAKIPGIEKQVTKIPEMEIKIAEMQIDIRNISRSVAVIEEEHGDKLKTLFDAFTTLTEKIEKQNNRISFCEQKLESHDMEIDTLKTKVQGL